ncbi:hypothetical protein DYB38_006434, partial [Aphanomyces astaci]
CLYDPDTPTFIPSDDKNDGSGHANFHHDLHGVGYRKGGWKLLRVRKDIGRPTERGHLAALEKALVHDPIRGDEIELYFTSDHHPSLKPSSSIAAIAPSSSSGPTLSSQPPPNLAPDEMDKWKKSGGGGGPPGQGVCYDFQNKGVCQRGPKCHFSHCACHNVCQCTPAGHTYGQRPDFRRNDLDAPPPDSSSANTPDGMTNLMEGGVVKDAAVVDDGGKMAGLVSPPDDAPTLPGGGALRVTSSSLSGVYAPLTAWDPEAVAAKRQLLTATANRRMWSSLGILDDGNASSAKKKKAGGRNYTSSTSSSTTTAKAGWIVTALGDVTYVRSTPTLQAPHDK